MPHNLSDSTDRKVTISLPDMFRDFVVDTPVVNSSYTAVRPESEKWLSSVMSLSPKQSKRVNYCDFTYFCSVLVPYASHEKLKVVSDWGNWVFLFDDMFDEGELTNDPQSSQRIMNNLLSIMVPEINRSSTEPAVAAHDSIYKRFAASAPPSVVKRYVSAMVSYCAGALQHVEDHTADRIPTIQEMLDIRRMSIGAFPMYPLVEFAYDLNLPDPVFSDPTIKTLENLGAELVMLTNDILSYPKEESENCPFNMIAVCRINGSTAQEAFDEIARMVDARFATWGEAMKTLPSWGDDVDAQVRQYIQGIQNIVQANLSWSFRTGRYFGPNSERVRQSREVDVLLQPPFLALQRVTA